MVALQPSATPWIMSVFALAARALADGILPHNFSLDSPLFDHRRLAIALDSAGRKKESHACFLASVRHREDKLSYAHLGISHMRRGEYLLAAQSFGRALARCN